MAPVKEPHFLAGRGGPAVVPRSGRRVVRARAGHRPGGLRGPVPRGARTAIGCEARRRRSTSRTRRRSRRWPRSHRMATVVVVLRDPVDRGHTSAWAYLRAQGREDAPTLLEGVQREDERRRRHYSPMWWYTGLEPVRGGGGAATGTVRAAGPSCCATRTCATTLPPSSAGWSPGSASTRRRSTSRSPTTGPVGAPGSLLALPSRLPPRQRQVLRAALPAPLLRRLETAPRRARPQRHRARRTGPGRARTALSPTTSVAPRSCAGSTCAAGPPGL